MLTAPGIQSSALFAECTYCRLPFCMSCRIDHQASHEQAVVLVRSIVYQFETDGETEACARCGKRVRFSYGCCECEYVLCRNCWFEKDINTHQHKIFNLIEPQRQIRNKQEDSCCSVPAVNHCSTCSAPFALGQDTIFCKTCYLQNNEPVLLCVRCYLLPGLSHSVYHEFWHWTVELAKPGGLMPGVSCAECSLPIRSKQDLREHPHTSYADVYTAKHLNQVIMKSYRQCQKKAVRVDNLMDTATDRCTICLQQTISLSNLSCQRCDEILRVCTHCQQHAADLHIHDKPYERSKSITQARNVDKTRSKSTPITTSIPSPLLSPPSSSIFGESPISPPLGSPRILEPTRSNDERSTQAKEKADKSHRRQEKILGHYRYHSNENASFWEPIPQATSQPHPEEAMRSKTTKHPHQRQPEQFAHPVSPPASPPSYYPVAEMKEARKQSQPTQRKQEPSQTSPAHIQPDLYKQPRSRPREPQQPIHQSHSLPPTPPVSAQVSPTYISTSKPLQPVGSQQSPKPQPARSPQLAQPVLRPVHTAPQPSHQPPPPVAIPDDKPTSALTSTLDSPPPPAPPVSRLNSAPEVLVSTTEHPPSSPPTTGGKRTRFAGGLKTAYAATQKSAATRIATRIVTKAAFGAVSNAIGTDISGAVDGVQGMANLAGSGIDGGNLVGRAVETGLGVAFDEAWEKGEKKGREGMIGGASGGNGGGGGQENGGQGEKGKRK